MPFVAMIARPNGSGKTTLTTFIREQGFDLGRYINPDDIAKGLPGSYDERVRAAQTQAVTTQAGRRKYDLRPEAPAWIRKALLAASRSKF